MSRKVKTVYNTMQYIERDLSKRPITDFLSNIKPKLNDSLVAEEVYKGSLLIGWKIISLTKV
jgi:hypothetical protein